MSPEVVVQEIEFTTLTLADRCDACGAAAVAQIIVDDELSMILLCGHHFRANKSHFDANLYAYEVPKEHAEPFTFGSKYIPQKRDAGSAV